MRTLLLLPALLACLLTAAPRAAFAQAAPPLVRPEALQQVSPHVHVIPDGGIPVVPNVGFVVDQTGVLVIDTGLGPRNGAAVADTARRLAAGRTIYLVTTHVHPEHDLGAQAFPADATFIRSTDQVREIEESGLQLARVFAGRSPAMAELLEGADFRMADVVFQEAYDLDLGGLTAQIFALGPNHTRGDTGVWVAADRVLFSGDVAMRAQPSLMTPLTSIGQWMASLDRLQALQAAIVVPSHGPVGDAGFITGYRAYLAEVRERTLAEKRAGRDVEQAVAAVTSAMSGRFPDAARLAGAVRIAYAEGG